MQFTLAEPNKREMLFHRKEDETGKYELFIFPVIFGWRVGFGEVGTGMYIFDYCAGNKQKDVEELYGKVEMILSKDIPLGEILRVLPFQERKPYFNDPKCLEALNILAKGYTPEKLPNLDVLRYGEIR